MLRTRLPALVLAVVLCTGLAACNRGKEATVPRAITTSAPPASSAPTVTADDYSFTVSGTLTADRTAITMKNDGDELHEWKFARMRPDVDINQAAEALQSGTGGTTGSTTSTTSALTDRTTTSRASRSGIRGQATTSTSEPEPTTSTAPPTTTATTTPPTSPSTTVRRATTTTARRATTTTSARRTTTTRRSTTGSTIPSDATGIDAVFEKADIGAPGSLLSPGESNTVTGDLDAGTYAVFCLLKASDGATHVAKGMIAELKVEDAGEPPADPPTDRTVTITDGRIDVGAKDFKAARTTFELTNGGEQKHNFSIVSLNEGETLRSLARYVQASFSTGPPASAPGRIIASVDTFESGDRIKVSVDLKPGTYTVACTYRDDEGTEDHLSAFGEQTTITVT